MIHLRKSSERGQADHGWLLAKHTFSFADYYDPDHMGYRSLRVINEDRVKPANGFGTHPHRDMEVLTYILEGALEHRDSMGNGSVIRPGDVQYMSAGSGVLHSEFNPSDREGVHLLQIWLLPDEKGATPRYGQKTFSAEEKRGKLLLVASKSGENGSIAIRQDAKLYSSVLREGESASLSLAKGRHAWIQVARGSVSANGTRLDPGDGASVSGEEKLEFVGKSGDSEFLVFDLD
jgi:redox-sensitive bicupin YhaK (pirin superfamily)